jgi:lactoylglutathione lyase
MTDHITARLELFAHDVDALRDFFVRVLRFEVIQTSPSYTEIASGDVRIGLAPVAGLPAGHPLRPGEPSDRIGLGVEIVLETDDVDAFYRHVQATGYAVSLPLGARSWGLRDFRVVAPDGYYVRVTSRAS